MAKFHHVHFSPDRPWTVIERDSGWYAERTTDLGPGASSNEAFGPYATREIAELAAQGRFADVAQMQGRAGT